MPAPRPVVVVCLTCIVALNTACSSMKTIDPVTAPGRSAFGPIKSGDTVVVDLRTGERHRFVVQQVDGEYLVAENGSRYPRSEMARVQRRSFSGPKTALLVGGIVVTWVALAIAAAYADILGGWQ